MITVETYADLPRRLGHHAFVVLALLQAARMMGIKPVTAQWLHDHAPGYGINSITSALRKLTSPELQLAVRVEGGWIFNSEGAFQLPLGYHLVPENHSKSESDDKNNEYEPDLVSQNHSESDFEPRIDENQDDLVFENHSKSESAPRTSQETLENLPKPIVLVPENHSKSESDDKNSLKYLRTEEEGDNLNLTSSPPPEFKDELAENRKLLEHSHLLFGEPGVLVDKLDQELLSAIPRELVRGWLNQAYFLHSKNKLFRPAGYVFSALQKYPEERPKDKFCHAAEDAYLPHEYLVEIGVRVKVCGLCRGEFGSMDAFRSHHEICKKSPEGWKAGEGEQAQVPLEADETVTERVLQVWEAAVEQIRADLPKAAFDTWVQDARPVHCADQRLTIAVRNAYARDWLNTRLKSTCERLLGGMSVSFVVST